MSAIVDPHPFIPPDSIQCPHCEGTGRISMECGTLAQRLRFLRANKGLSLREIPGISSASYSRYENGHDTNMTADLLVKVADFFEVSTDWLLGRKHAYPVKAHSYQE